MIELVVLLGVIVGVIAIGLVAGLIMARAVRLFSQRR